MARFLLSAFADEAGNTLDEQIAALKENRIRFIEPRFVGGKAILDHTDEELQAIYEKLDSEGIMVNSLGSPIGKYDITLPLEPHFELFMKAIKACKLLHTDKMRMFSFFVEQSELKKHRDKVIEALKYMVKIATEEGITLCHENESKIYGQMPSEVHDVLTSVDGLGGIFDPANYRMNNGDVMEGIKATLINLSYLHIKDAHYESQTVLPAGEGEGRIAKIIDIVNEHTDSDVYLTLEPHLLDFLAYKSIDTHELRGKYSFKNNREAFDFAVNSLKKLLTDNGYREVGVGEWIK